MRYKGYTIQPTTDPWAIKYGYNYEFFVDEHIRHASSLEEAIQEIDERTGDYSWGVCVNDRDPVTFENLKDAIGFQGYWNATPLFSFNSI